MGKFFHEDGLTLKHPPEGSLSDLESILEYIDGVSNEAEKNQQVYSKFTLHILFTSFITAANPACVGSLSESDLRGIIGSGIQWVELYALTMGEDFTDHVDEDGSLISPPWDSMGMYFDTLLFIVELTDPTVNLLTVKRPNFDVAIQTFLHQQELYESPEVQHISQITWRNSLLSNGRFVKDFHEMKNALGHEHWTFFNTSRTPPFKDSLVYFQDGKIDQVILETDSHENYGKLKIFCESYRIEMVGTYLSERKGMAGLHVLPMRVHAMRSKWGIRVEIPDFYSISDIRNNLDTDFYELKTYLQEGGKVHKSESFLTDAEFSKVGTIIRKILRSQGTGKALTNGYIKKIYSEGLYRNYSSILKETVNIEIPEADPDTLISELNEKAKNASLEVTETALWSEFMRYVTYRGLYTPFS